MSERLNEKMTENANMASINTSAANRPETRGLFYERVKKAVGSISMKLFSPLTFKHDDMAVLDRQTCPMPQKQNVNREGSSLTLEEYIGGKRYRAIQNGEFYTISFGTGREIPLKEYAEKFVQELEKELGQKLSDSQGKSE